MITALALTLLTWISVEPWQVRSIDGQSIALDADNVKATAFVFVTNTCPIANAYQPRLRELQSEYEKRGIQFVEVYPVAALTQEDVVTHRREFEIKAACVLDPGLTLAKRLGAKVTPEAIVVDRAGRVLYRGRIDDQHAALGKKRPQASQHDLANAFQAIVSDQPIAISETKPVGCIIRY